MSWKKKVASYSHRTATTVYPCCLPTLGDSTGAGRIRLATGSKVINNYTIYFEMFLMKKSFKIYLLRYNLSVILDPKSTVDLAALSSGNYNA